MARPTVAAHTNEKDVATGEVREFTWDQRNRLTTVVDKNANGNVVSQIEYRYDALDRRVAKNVIEKYLGPSPSEPHHCERAISEARSKKRIAFPYQSWDRYGS